MHSHTCKGTEWPFLWEMEKCHFSLASDILLIISNHVISKGTGPIYYCQLWVRGGGLHLAKDINLDSYNYSIF